MKKVSQAADRLAGAFIAGPFDEPSLMRRAASLVQGRKAWLKPLIGRIVGRFGPVRPRKHRLVEFLLHDEGLLQAALMPGFAVNKASSPTQFLAPEGRFAHLDVPRWNTVADLAHWLGLASNELDWFADRKRLERVSAEGPLRHYRYRWIRKRNGLCRLIEAPKQRLAGIQRRLLKELFELVPVHDAAHGFRKGRSVGTYTDPHVGRKVVLKMDLEDFFPTIPPSRLVGLLMSIGYAEDVARTVTALCSNSAPADAWTSFPAGDDRQQRRQARLLLQRAHFPQGAPTSPAIANICSFRLDCRLDGLARRAGAVYTRYADDLLFSGGEDFKRRISLFHIHVATIALDEGFKVNFHKTRIMTQSRSQRAAGLVLNTKQNTGRDEFDRLKAILHNCVLNGPVSENRSNHPDFRAHLLGRINYVRQWNEPRARKLISLFERIHWGEAGADDV